MKSVLGAGIRWGLGATAAAAALLAPAKEAMACSFPACSPPVRLSGMQFVPGNLVYFEVTTDTPGAMSLRTEAGEPIAASIRTIGNDRVFAPDAPIAPETNLVLEYEESCYDGSEAPVLGEFAFRTFEHLPITLQPGELFVAEYGVAYPGQGNNEFGFVRVQVRPSADYAAEHLMTHTLSIDGAGSWSLVGSAWLVSIETRCEQQYSDIQYDSCGGVWAVPEGRHTLELKTHILGQDTPLEPLTLEIETRCPKPDTEIESDGNDDGDDNDGDDPAPTGEDTDDATPTGQDGDALPPDADDA